MLDISEPELGPALGRPSGHASTLVAEALAADKVDVFLFRPALTVRIMLADLDHYEMLEPVQRLQPAVGARRLALLDDFRRLRNVLG